MSETAYNGWEGNGTRESAYATWRVNLEIVDDIVNRDRQGFEERYDEKPDEYTLGEALKAEVEELVCLDDPDAERIATQYALAFLDDVNWMEIAEHVLLDWES
jgi:hypothetical protein